MVDRNLRDIAVAVGGSSNGDRNNYHMIPVGMGCFPGFLSHVECFHACDLLVIAIRKEPADIVEAIAIVGAEEIGGKGLL